MEEKKDYRQQNNVQKFYFNEDGQLVVESNKGVWVDGEQYVKMYGNFSCNAKTMGIIISQLKGIPAFVIHKQETEDYFWGEYKHTIECLINPSVEQAGLLSEIREKDATIKQQSESIAELQKKTGEDGDQISALKKSIGEFNALPWYKRIFKKIEI